MLKNEPAATLKALTHFEIPENVSLVAALFDEVFAARDQYQEVLLRLGSMLHNGDLQRPVVQPSAPAARGLRPPTRKKSSRSRSASKSAVLRTKHAAS